MDWLVELFTSGGGVAHTVILYAIVISFGVFLGNKIKIGGISLGVTWILFIGILAGDLLMRGGIKENIAVINFIQDFRKILAQLFIIPEPCSDIPAHSFEKRKILNRIDAQVLIKEVDQLAFVI